MNEWNKVKLSDIAIITMGQSPKGNTVSADSDDMPLLNGPSEFTEYCPLPVQFTTDSRRISQKDDLLFCVRGSTTGRMNWSDRSYAIGRGIAALRHKKGSDYQAYLRAIIESKMEQLLSLSTGSTFPNLSKSTIEELTFDAPDFRTQDQLSKIISNYDLLILNNQRRIKILEEMAQRLYTEWFVKFNFPGHENVKMVDSGTEFGEIAEGWEIVRIGDKLNVQYGKTLSKTRIEKSGKYPVYGAGGIIGYYGSKNVNSRTTLITCRGNGSGTVWRTRGEGFVTNNSLIIEGLNEELPFCFLYYAMKNSNISSSISGSAQPQITINNLNYVSFLNPNKEIVDKFNMITTGYFRLIDQAVVFSKNIQTIRDLLTENLVTGKRLIKN